MWLFGLPGQNLECFCGYRIIQIPPYSHSGRKVPHFIFTSSQLRFPARILVSLLRLLYCYFIPPAFLFFCTFIQTALVAYITCLSVSCRPPDGVCHRRQRGLESRAHSSAGAMGARTTRQHSGPGQHIDQVRELSRTL